MTRLAYSITPKLIWNASASAPIGLYTVRTAADLGVTDLVAVDAPEPLTSFLSDRDYLPRGVPLMKRIAALPGQTVCRIGRIVTVDAIAMGEALARDRRGRELPVWQGERNLPHELARPRQPRRPLLWTDLQKLHRRPRASAVDRRGR